MKCIENPHDLAITEYSTIPMINSFFQKKKVILKLIELKTTGEMKTLVFTKKDEVSAFYEHFIFLLEDKEV